jgi:hypothetical protein
MGRFIQNLSKDGRNYIPAEVKYPDWLPPDYSKPANGNTIQLNNRLN